MPTTTEPTTQDATGPLSRDDVWDACDRLHAAGEAPSAAKLRVVLARGSMTTIQAHLRAWRSERARVHVAAIPPEVLGALRDDLVAGAVAGLDRHLPAIIDHLVRPLHTQLASAQEQAAHLQNAEQESDLLVDQLQARIAEMETTLANAGADLTQSRQDIATLIDQRDQARAASARAEAELTAARAGLQREQVHRESLEKTASDLRQVLAQSQGEVSRLVNDLDATRARLAEQTQTCQAYEADCRRAQAQASQLEQQLAGERLVTVENQRMITALREEHATFRSFAEREAARAAETITELRKGLIASSTSRRRGRREDR